MVPIHGFPKNCPGIVVTSQLNTTQPKMQRSWIWNRTIIAFFIDFTFCNNNFEQLFFSLLSFSFWREED